MKKKYLAIATSTAMISGMVLGSAFAENLVNVKITSEPITEKTVCGKVGGFTLEFDGNTVLKSGDRITIDTDYVSAGNLTALCNGLDFMITPDATGSDEVGESGLSWDSNTVDLSSDGSSPVYYEGTTAPSSLDPDDNETGGVNFKVFGAKGGQRISVDVIGHEDANSTLTVAADDPGSKLVVKFLDQAVIGAPYVTKGIYVDKNNDRDYSDAAAVTDNTLCLDVSNFDNNKVFGSVDSAADKYTFLPTGPQIAHIVANPGYDVVECKKQDCGTVEIGKAVGQEGGSDTCNDFTDVPARNYCDAPATEHANNDLIFKPKTGFFAIDNYQIEMTILVDEGQGFKEGDFGVYFANDAPSAAAFTSDTAACDDDDLATLTPTYYLANDSVTSSDALGEANCEVADAGRAVRLITAANGLGADGATTDYLKVMIPALNYDVNKVQPGANVRVKVTLNRAPCGYITEAEHCVGQLVSACASTPEGGNNLKFPYFTEGTTDGFWDGIAVTNTSNSAGKATITIYETDGDIAVANIDLAAMSMYVNTLQTMIDNNEFTLDPASPNGVLGNARSQIVVTSETLKIDGFAMMGNNTTGVSMGYLPRLEEPKTIQSAANR